MNIKNLLKSVLLITPLFASAAYAVPVLQLGPDGSNNSPYYDTTTDTWMLSPSGGSFSFDAYNLDGGTAYLIFAAMPQTKTDAFDINVSGDSGALTMTSSGYGTPPFSDPNSLAPHGIYDTWSEIYQINFDGSQTTVYDTQPGQTGSALGYSETVNVDINSMLAGTTGIHVDLFTMDDQGQVTHFAPYSHDLSTVPVPAAVWLFGSGLLGLVGVARRRRS
jgi:hypothetical protein